MLGRMVPSRRWRSTRGSLGARASAGSSPRGTCTRRPRMCIDSHTARIGRRGGYGGFRGVRRARFGLAGSRRWFTLLVHVIRPNVRRKTWALGGAPWDRRRTTPCIPTRRDASRNQTRGSAWRTPDTAARAPCFHGAASLRTCGRSRTPRPTSRLNFPPTRTCWTCSSWTCERGSSSSARRGAARTPS